MTVPCTCCQLPSGCRCKASRHACNRCVIHCGCGITAVDAGIVSMEREFFAELLLPDGRTVGQLAAPEVAQAYATGRMPIAMLTGGAG